jgi:hypothetical protein
LKENEGDGRAGKINSFGFPQILDEFIGEVRENYK